MSRYFLAAAGASLIASCASNGVADRPLTKASGDYWFDGAQATLADRKALQANKGPAKNVILFVADGMDPTTVAAARIYDGQTRGEDGEENLLSFERFPALAMSKTYNTDTQTPDSAGTMSAMTTGYKTKAAIIALDNTVKERGDCASALKAKAATFIEKAEQAGLSTGVVSTARLTHATPAANYAHAPDRDWESDAKVPAGAAQLGCKDIASQLIDFSYGDGVDLAMGGGRTNFIPETVADPENTNLKGMRKDGRNLVDEWKAKSSAHSFVWNKAQFDAVDPATDPRVLGLFEPSHMQYEADRKTGSDGEPSLEEMTRKAIEILSRNEKGFVLVVEAGRVDHAHHDGNAARALHDAQEFSQAIAAARSMTDEKDTLIIATADHGHTLTFAGYPLKGNNILGVATTVAKYDFAGDGIARAADGKKYTTLGYANGPGAVFKKGADLSDGRPEPTNAEATELDFKQPSLVPMGDETHGGQDVTIYASGPNAYLFSGVVEQNYIFHVIVDALGLGSR
jgi:alkaline phosphatase